MLCLWPLANQLIKASMMIRVTTGYACHTVCYVVPLTPGQPVDQGLNDDQGDHVRHCLLNIVRHLGGLCKRGVFRTDDVEKSTILDGRLCGHRGQGDVCHPQTSTKEFSLL